MRARLRALRSARSRRSKKTDRSTATRATVLAALAEACAQATVGLEVCAKRSRNPAVVERATALAADAHRLADAIASERDGARPRIRMGDRMRWEWLTSTGSFLDAAPERRTIAECLRVFESAIELASTFHGAVPFASELVRLIRAIDSLHDALALTFEPALASR